MMLSVRRGRTRWGDGMTKTVASEREVDITVRLLPELRELASERSSGSLRVHGSSWCWL